MQYGISIPNYGETWHPATLATYAREAEDAGWDGFFIWDHVMMGAMPTADPWVALAAIALATKRMMIGPMVTPIPRRRPVKLAREVVTLDHLSNGRLILGVGIGARKWEWDDLGEETDLKKRGAMLDEGLDLLTKIWSGESVDHHGDYYSVAAMMQGATQPARFLPQPVRGKIPIWVAGMWPNKAPFRRAARWDGVFPIRASNLLDGTMMPTSMLAEIVQYTNSQRTSTQPLDVVLAGLTPGDPDAAAAVVAPYSAAGCTWWLEDVSPFAYGWQWQGPWPLEQMHARILAGPPRR